MQRKNKVSLDHGSKTIEGVTTDKQKSLMKALGMKNTIKLQRLGLKLYKHLCPKCREDVHLNPYQPQLCPGCKLKNNDILTEMQKLAEGIQR